MVRLPLDVVQGLHRPSQAAGYSLSTVRVLNDVVLRTATGWTMPKKIVVDTGATVSLFPMGAWREAEIEPIAQVRTAGVVNRPECMVSAICRGDSRSLSGHKTRLIQIHTHASARPAIMPPVANSQDILWSPNAHPPARCKFV